MDTQALLAAARDDMVTYAVLVDALYRPNNFHRFMAKWLHQAIKEEHARLIIEAPPQVGKSTLISQILPAYILGLHPDWPVISASYGDDLVNRNGEAVRRMLTSSVHHDIFPKSVISPSTHAKSNFDTTARGKYYGTTIRGGGTGFPAKVFIVDDPFKNRDDANSKEYRDTVWSWFKSVVIPRLNRNTILAVMHTRWSDDDLVARIEKHHAHENFTKLSLPALALDDDPMGRALGEPLVPERFDREDYKRIRISVDDEWSPLYMQKPITDSLRTFRREDLRYHELDLRQTVPMNRYLICDPSSGRGRDYCAMGVIGLHHDNNAYLLDFYRDMLSLTERGKLFIELHKRWQPMESGYEQFGMQADIEYILELQERLNYRFSIIPLAGPLTGPKKKESRIKRLQPWVKSHRWYMPKVIWRTDSDGIMRNVIDEVVEQEMLPFPTGANDDGIDMFSRIFDFPPVWPKLRTGDADTPLTHLESLRQRSPNPSRRDARLNKRGARGH